MKITKESIDAVVAAITKKGPKVAHEVYRAHVPAFVTKFGEIIGEPQKTAGNWSYSAPEVLQAIRENTPTQSPPNTLTLESAKEQLFQLLLAAGETRKIQTRLQIMDGCDRLTADGMGIEFVDYYGELEYITDSSDRSLTFSRLGALIDEMISAGAHQDGWVAHQQSRLAH